MVLQMIAAGAAPLVQASRAVPTTPTELILHGEPLTQAVLVFLALLSVLSWAIMIGLWRQMGQATATATKFAEEFEHSSRLEEGAALARRAKPNALSRILLRAVLFVSDTRVQNQQARERDAQASGGGGLATMAPGVTLSGSQVETLYLVLDGEAAAERDRLGRFIPMLAMIASASPLIGLLGTVLGIINSFLGIATQGSGNISAVAPGVGEALTATAMGIAVAIPATFGYNIFASRLNRYEGLMENFGTSVIARLVREGHI